MPPLRNVTQADACRVFVAFHGIERGSKKNYRMIVMPNGNLLSIPSGTLKIGLLRKLIRLAGMTVEQFQEDL